MARSKIQISGFAGLNKKSPPHMLKDKELAECENFYFGQDGELKKRPGLKLHVDGPVADAWPYVSINNNTVATWARIDLGQDQIWANMNNKLYLANFGNPFVEQVSPVANPIVNWTAIYDDKTYVGFNVNQIYRQDFGAFTLLTNSPVNSHHGCFHKNRLFVLIDVAGTSTLRWSDAPGDPSFPVPFTDWPATNTWNIGGGTQLSVADTAHYLVSFNDILYIFKKASIWALHVQGDSPASWTLRQVNPNIGCSSPHGILVVENYMYFLANTSLNIKSLIKTDGYSFQVVSEPVEPVLNFDEYVDVVNYGPVGLTPVRYEDNILFVRWEFSETTGPQYLLCYNYKLDIWSTWYFPNHYILSLLEGYDSNADAWVVYAWGSPSLPTAFASRLYRLSVANKTADAVYSDVSLGYTSKLRTKEFMGRQDEYQRIMRASLDYTGAAGMDARYITELGTTELTATAAGGTRSDVHVKGPGLCRRVSYEFDDAAATTSLKVYSFGMDFSKNTDQGKAKVS